MTRYRVVYNDGVRTGPMSWTRLLAFIKDCRTRARVRRLMKERPHKRHISHVEHVHD